MKIQKQRMSLDKNQDSHWKSWVKMTAAISCQREIDRKKPLAVPSGRPALAQILPLDYGAPTPARSSGIYAQKKKISSTSIHIKMVIMVA